ncbi:MAG: hypothetical protein ACREH5_05970, partial [Candidatus Omnitrophota bacterium]
MAAKQETFTNPFLLQTDSGEFLLSVHNCFSTADGKTVWRVVKLLFPTRIIQEHSQGTDERPGVPVKYSVIGGRQQKFTGVEVIDLNERLAATRGRGTGEFIYLLRVTPNKPAVPMLKLS